MWLLIYKADMRFIHTSWYTYLLQKAQAVAENVEITIRIQNDGSVRKGVKNVTSSMDLCKQLDKSLQKAALSSEVDGQVWDLLRPLEGDCTIKILTWEDPKGKDVSCIAFPRALFLAMTPNASSLHHFTSAVSLVSS